MRAHYYNADIKRFINQDIKIGDIGSSQSLNRYAYCEGNPVSMVDPFGLCGENPNDQGKKSKYQFWHNVLDVAGLFFDVADVVNAAIYAYEKDWTNAAICAASAIPAVGAAVIGVAKSAKAVIKAKKAEKIASLAAEASRMTKNAANTLDTFSDTMRVVEKYGKSAIKSADNIISDAGSKVIKALETGGDVGKEASKAVKSAETAVSAGGLRLSTKVDDAADALKSSKRADFYVKPNGDVVPSTGYRYMSSKNAEEALNAGQQYATYIGFVKYDSAEAARDGFQVALNWSDCKVRGDFDTLQVIDDMYIPTTLGNTTNIPEPFTVSYPEYGKGGIQQFRVDKVIKFLEVIVIGD